MRSTRATAAVERLKTRSGDASFSMVRTADERFYLTQLVGGEPPRQLCDALQLDEFVSFVNAFGPQIPRRMTKSDIAFEKQLMKKME